MLINPKHKRHKLILLLRNSERKIFEKRKRHLMYKGQKIKMTENVHQKQCKPGNSCKVWEHSRKVPSFLTPIVNVGVPKMTFSLVNMLEGFIKLKIVIFTVIVYYRKKIPIKIS